MMRATQSNIRKRDAVASATSRDAFADGYNARALGRPRSSCPYTNKRDRQNWASGYTAAEGDGAGD